MKNMQMYDFFLNQNPFLNRAKYVAGVPNMNDDFLVSFEPTIDYILFKNGSTGKEIFKLDKKDVVNIFVEDDSTIENRVGLTRLLLVGIFALAWKKKSKNPMSFIIFEYNDDIGTTQKMLIQSDSNTGYQFFNNVKYNLLKFWKEADENPDEFNNAIIEAQSKHIKNKEIESKNVKNGCLILVVIFIAVLIYQLLSK